MKDRLELFRGDVTPWYVVPAFVALLVAALAIFSTI